MNKITDFFKSNIIVVKWTAWYFFGLWAILKYLFKFDMFSYHYWWKFFHATLHGFPGFIFGALVYSAIPLYIVTTIITYRKKEYVIKIPVIDKAFAYISKIFAKKTEEPKSEPEPEQHNTEQEPENTEEYPSDLPPELRIPFMRAKQHMSINGAISVYNQQARKTSTPEQTQPEPDEPQIPIPTDFDIGDSFDDMHDSFPTFTDINFDTPIATEQELKNETTKYMTEHNIEYETYRNFVATDKYLIYEHNDADFWIMDGDSWFASGKQIDSPINELKDIAKQNEIKPVIYLAQQNIMNLDETIANLESTGIRVVKSLDELD